MRAPLMLVVNVLGVALLAPGCFLDRSALGEQPPDIDAAGVDAFVPRVDAGPNDSGEPVCVPSSPVDLCDGADDDCDPGTADGSGEATFGEPCDGDDMGVCADGMVTCDGADLACSEVPRDTVETCNGSDDDCNGEIDDDAGCPCPQASFGGHSYLFCGTAAPWQDAIDACPVSYELVRIDSQEEQVFVVGRAHGIAAGAWWLGGSASSDGMWRWLVGGDLIPRTGGGGFSNWNSGEPNSDDECLQADTNATGSAGITGEWNDQSCTTARRYVCESVPMP